MATKENINWKRINMGDILPCQSFLRKKDGEILKLSTSGGVKVGQDCYYLPVDEVINVIKDYPVEESEDEKIRCTLINHFKTQVDLSRTWNGLKIPDILAWLEKKGQTFTKKDVDDAYLKGICDAKRELEKQGGKKPILDVEIPFGAKDSELEDVSYDIPKGYHAEIEDNKVVIKKGELKPIKHNNEATIDHNLNDYCCKVYNALHKENGGNLSFERLQHLAMDIYKWCKEQQKPSEWSEEDEKHIMSINLAVSRCIGKWHCCGEKCPISEHSPWLKSLKDRYTWKPSCEQMVALDGICSYIRNKADWEISQDMVSDLYKLSEQLKKLRGE